MWKKYSNKEIVFERNKQILATIYSIQNIEYNNKNYTWGWTLESPYLSQFEKDSCYGFANSIEEAKESAERYLNDNDSTSHSGRS